LSIFIYSVYVVAIWYILRSFGINFSPLHQERSGSPVKS
jgi:hypothetical protein